MENKIKNVWKKFFNKKTIRINNNNSTDIFHGKKQDKEIDLVVIRQ